MRFVRLTEHGVIITPEFVKRPMYGIVGGMAWRFNGERLHLVRFEWSERLHIDANMGRQRAVRRFETHTEINQKKARRVKRYRARKRASA